MYQIPFINNFSVPIIFLERTLEDQQLLLKIILIAALVLKIIMRIFSLFVEK